MASNFPGPYQLRYYYTSAPGLLPQFTHVLQFNIDLTDPPTPGDAFLDLEVERRVGVPVALNAVSTAFVDVFKAILSLADQEILYAELWAYTPGTFDAQYISTETINTAGTNGGSSTAAQQDIWTFRTLEGGIMKIYTQECIDTGVLQDSYSDLDQSEKDFADWFFDDASSYALGRDTSYPHAFFRRSAGQSEHMFKLRFR